MYRIDPTKDERWTSFVEKNPQASVFHTRAWLQSLQGTYGYEPVGFTDSPPGRELKNTIVFCQINSWLTGRRLVSLPFSDHCELLCGSAEEAKYLLRNLQAELKNRDCKYLELRPLDDTKSGILGELGFKAAATYLLHVLDLTPDLDTIFRRFDKDSVRRRVDRANRAGLVEKIGTSDELLEDFYDLFVLTRARQRLPPIPAAWFRNLVKHLGPVLQIRLAYKEHVPISAIITLQFKDTVFYKYGCSNARFNKYGATPWIFWHSITAAKSAGATRFDFGRTEPDNPGLLAFKNNWVPQARRITYWKYPATSAFISLGGWKLKLAKRAFSCMPTSVLRMTGKMIYRHIG